MHVHHLAFRGADIESLATFYSAVLGLPRLKVQPGYSIWLGLDAAVLMLEQRLESEPAPSAQSLELVAFAVDVTERERVRQRLFEAGGNIEGETEHTIYFRDPEGRRVGVSSYPLSSVTGPADTEA